MGLPVFRVSILPRIAKHFIERASLSEDDVLELGSHRMSVQSVSTGQVFLELSIDVKQVLRLEVVVNHPMESVAVRVGSIFDVRSNAVVLGHAISPAIA
jgi:hypothetical protein